MNSGLASKELLSRDGSQTDTPCRIMDLPNEVLEDIFSYIDPIELHEQVSIVSKRFHDVIQNDSFWRFGFHNCNRLQTSNYSPFLKHLGLYSHKWKSGEDMRWRDLCVIFERAKKTWFNKCKTTNIAAGYMTIDSVHLMEKQDILLSGSRSRLLEVWNLNDTSRPIKSASAHRSWISGVNTLDDLIITCSYDYQVKLWSAARLEPLCYVNVLNAAMSIDVRPRMVVCCTFPDLIIIDPRIARSDNFCSSSVPGGSAVQVKLWNDYVIIATRNKKLIKYDLRQQEVVDCTDISSRAPPKVLEIRNNVAYIGDTLGSVYLYDLRDKNVLIDEYDVSQQAQIRFLSPKDGYMIVGSKDGQLRVVSNVKRYQEPFLLNSINLGDEIITGHYRPSKLAVVTINQSVNVKIFDPRATPNTTEEEEVVQEQ